MATSQEEILSGIASVINEVTGIPVSSIQRDKSFMEDLEIDSLSMVEIIVAAEEQFGVRIPDEDAMELRTVGDAIDYITKLEASLTAS
jgi:acyl carrier protein